MTTWQWQVIMALVRFALSGIDGVIRSPEAVQEDLAILREAAKREDEKKK